MQNFFKKRKRVNDTIKKESTHEETIANQPRHRRIHKYKCTLKNLAPIKNKNKKII